MTREELKVHCEKQIKECEMWAKHKGEEPSGKVYEEHKLILELLEQEPKTGHWIRQDNTKKPLYGWYFCSECNSVIGDKPKFCSNCGARMEDKE